MIRRLPAPRLLPITILAMGLLLAVKSASLVRAAAGEAAAPPAHGAPAAPAPTAPTPPAPTPAAPVQAAPTPAQPPPSAATAAPLVPPAITDTERKVLLELRDRRQALDAREATVAAREATLQAAEHRLDDRVQQLEALQKKLETLEAARQQREDASWAGLVKLYEAMRPRDAATIFNDLDMNVLLQVVDRMKEAKAAPILAAMQPDKARDLTAKLAAMRIRRDTPAAGG